MAAEISIAPVLEHYPGLGPIRRVHSLANAGGFSGSMLWRLEREAGDLCMRRWPKEHPSEERLAFIHGVLRTLGQSGLNFIPAPYFTRDDRTFLSHGGNLWELAPWMPGKADFRENPSRPRLTSVMHVLAGIHRETQAFSPPIHQVCPTLLSRREQLHRLLNGGADQLTGAVDRHGDSELQTRGRRLLAYFLQRAPVVASSLESLQSTRVPLFPVIRDLWHDHVLFVGDEVTGIVDFGAMRVDSAACDLSRLLGSLVGNDRDTWEFTRLVYNSTRPLYADEWKLAQALDEANVILGGLNWLDWICVQGRIFEDYAAIFARLDDYLARLEER
ncbi:MAG: phosphotransferase enzyme family protein [Pirellulaceae bacterium]